MIVNADRRCFMDKKQKKTNKKSPPQHIVWSGLTGTIRYKLFMVLSLSSCYSSDFTADLLRFSTIMMSIAMINSRDKSCETAMAVPGSLS